MALVESEVRIAKAPITFTNLILEEGSHTPEAMSLSIVLNNIAEGTKQISALVRKSGLNEEMLESTGESNAYDEIVQKLDRESDEILTEYLASTGQVSVVGTEEKAEPLVLDPTKPYKVVLDPIDGSSNIPTAAGIGTIFGVYETGDSPLQFQSGRNQVAAGYVLYGASTELVCAVGNGVNQFTLDPAIGSFLLSRKGIQIPEDKKEYALNEGYRELFERSLRDYLRHIQKTGKYKSRHIGSMVADMHRIFQVGGIFAYPANEENKSGKLRLVYEVNPFSLLVEKAGGLTYSGKKNPLDIFPKKHDQRVPVVMGSRVQVEEYMKFYQGEGAMW